MKGIIFNLLEDVVVAEFGQEAWEGVLEDSQVDGAYTSVGNYPDGHLLAIVDAASKRTHMPPADVVRWFGLKSMPLLAQKYPHFFSPYSDTRAFLLTLNDIIHSEVRKLYPGADTPAFEFETPTPQSLRMGYRSKRKMCALAEGFIQGAAEHYGQTVAIHQAECMLRGDARCLFDLTFAQKAPKAGS